nr:arrestin domain-containing protein 3-like [Leptinotarsa decemlineata]XP_023029530.1 arrestin domain-containing protein 3-like [Leptinotarsa decemlineata]XP_023029540.1 arrestin domain-containing protein 3-like [Leptinotarsa decemlineata]
MAQCKVWLDNYTGQYYPGSQIQGKVVLNFETETKLRAVKVRVICHEHVEFMGMESYHDPVSNERKSRDTLFQGDNDTFATELILYGGHSGATSLPIGQYIHPFNLILPNNLPGTYSCEYGYINFKLIAIVDRPLALDYEDQIVFIVRSPVDLNALMKPDLLEPTSYSEDKTICCFCCADGPIALDIELPKRTLIPGETVNVMARLSNLSSTNIENIQLKLKQVITCQVDIPSKDENEIENILVEITEVGLGAHGEHTYNFPLMLPMNVPIPNFSLCKLFKVDYQCKVTAKLPGVHSNLEVYMYPQIGNIDIGHASNQMEGYPLLTPISPPADHSTIQYPPTNGQGYPLHPASPGFVIPPPGEGCIYPSSAPLTQSAPPSYDSLQHKK